MSTVAMGRTKASESKPLPDKTIAFRVSGEYGQWVERVAKANRSNVATLLDMALARYAKEIGVTEAAPER